MSNINNSMNIDGLNYRQWQKRNTQAFHKLQKSQQQTAREQGYYNIGWQKVQQSWLIIQSLTQPLSFFDAKLKNGDLSGAITQTLLEVKQAKKIAQKGKANLQNQYKKIQEITESALNKYQLL